jgi:hypothetical protein
VHAYYENNTVYVYCGLTDVTHASSYNEPSILLLSSFHSAFAQWSYSLSVMVMDEIMNWLTCRPSFVDVWSCYVQSDVFAAAADGVLTL